VRYRSLGRSGLTVSEVGFGAWGIGGDAGGSVAYGPSDRAESLAALRHAFDRGITFYDTADFYGHGLSEELLGEAFAGRRRDVVIASKGGMLRNGAQVDCSPGHLRAALDASLARLRSDYVDLYQLHSPSPEAIGEDTFATLLDLQAQGKIVAIGLSARSPEEAKRVLERFPFAAVQVNFSLVDLRAVECGLLEVAQQRGIGVIARTPLGFGFLTARYAADTEFHVADHRRRWSPEQRRVWADAPRLFEERMRRLPGQTAAQFALRFCLSQPGISAAIPGMLTPAHVEENARAGGLPLLDEAERREIEAVCSDNTFFVGRP
jgi:aryl-alcohol dehydrogenase-like predicted oxidoreductase